MDMKRLVSKQWKLSTLKAVKTVLKRCSDKPEAVELSCKTSSYYPNGRDKLRHLVITIEVSD